MTDYYLTHNLVSTNKQPPNTNTSQQCVSSTPISSIVGQYIYIYIYMCVCVCVAQPSAGCTGH